MATFSNKRVWHSFLKSKSPLTLMFTSDIMDSKFDADARIVFIRVAGDETEGYYYQIESPEIEEQIVEAGTRQWFEVTASGGVDEEPRLLLKPVDGPAAGSSKPRQSSGGNSSGNTQSGGWSPDSVDRYGADDILSQYKEVMHLVKNDPDLEWDDDDTFYRHVGFLFIQWSKTGRRVPLYPGQGFGGFSEDDLTDLFETLAELSGSVKWKGKAHDDSDLSKVKTRIAGFIGNADTTRAELEGAIAWLQAEVDFQTGDDPEDDELPF